MSENSDNLKIYSDNNKSQGSVATHLKYGGFAVYYRIVALSDGERIFKIGTHLAKWQAK